MMCPSLPVNDNWSKITGEINESAGKEQNILVKLVTGWCREPDLVLPNIGDTLEVS